MELDPTSRKDLNTTESFGGQILTNCLEIFSKSFCTTAVFSLYGEYVGLVNEPKISLYGRETHRDIRSACRCVA